MENPYIQLVPVDISFLDEITDYYKRNRDFLKEFEPSRGDEFFTVEYQQKLLEYHLDQWDKGQGFRFYIVAGKEKPKVIGIIALSNVVHGAFCSAHLGYNLDKEYNNKGIMTAAVGTLTEYAFDVLKLHRIEGNVMPRNKASLRVLEKNGFINEGISKYYLNINGVWEDHVHMVKINYAMH